MRYISILLVIVVYQIPFLFSSDASADEPEQSTVMTTGATTAEELDTLVEMASSRAPDGPKGHFTTARFELARLVANGAAFPDDIERQIHFLKLEGLYPRSIAAEYRTLLGQYRYEAALKVLDANQQGLFFQNHHVSTIAKSAHDSGHLQGSILYWKVAGHRTGDNSTDYLTSKVAKRFKSIQQKIEALPAAPAVDERITRAHDQYLEALDVYKLEQQGVKGRVTAQSLARLAANKGSADAYFLLWQISDNKSNVHNLVNAARGGSIEAAFELGLIELETPRPSEAHKWLKIAAEGDFPGASDKLALANEQLETGRRAKAAREQEEKDQLLAKQTAEKDRLASLDIPTLDSAEFQRVLNRALKVIGRQSDVTLSAAMGIPEDFLYECDADYCYAMGGIVKYRLKLNSLEKCDLIGPEFATCHFVYRHDTSSTLSAQSDIRNQLLDSILKSSPLRAVADLAFDGEHWNIVGPISHQQ